MRPRSIAGPVILIGLGALLLLGNLRPDFSFWTNFARYWPFLLIIFGVLRLAEVLIDAGRGTLSPAGCLPGRRRNGGGIGIVIIACIVFWAVAHGHRGIHISPSATEWNRGRLEIFGDQFDYPISGKGDATGIKMIVLEGLRGNITVTGDDGNEYSAEGRKTVRAYNKAEADDTDRKSPVQFNRNGSQMVIRLDEGNVSSDRNISTEIDLKVPRGVSIEARGRSGDVTVTSITGTVDLTSDRGDIRLNQVDGNAHLAVARSGLIRVVDAKGSVDLEGKGTDVQIENAHGPVTINGSYSGTMEFKNLSRELRFQSPQTDMRVEQLPGSLTLDLGDLRANDVVGPMRFHTKSRDIHIEGFTDQLDLDVTDRGDIDIDTTKLPLGKLDMHTKNGNISLALPEKASFDLRETTHQGEAQNEFGPEVRVELAGRTASLKSADGKGPAINAFTDRGSISVRKSSAAKD